MPALIIRRGWRAGLLAVLLMSLATAAEGKPDTLVLHVTSIVRQKGVIDVTVYKNDRSFLSDTSWFLNTNVRLDSAKTKGFCDITVLLPKGEYAYVVFQDINSNGNLDVNWIGYPNEPFAFSRQYRPLFRAPRFDEVSFRCKSSRDTITVILGK